MNNCRYCKKELVPKTFDSGNIESPSQTKNRHYCNNDCYQEELEEKRRLKKVGDKAMDKFNFAGWRL